MYNKNFLSQTLNKKCEISGYCFLVYNKIMKYEGSGIVSGSYFMLVYARIILSDVCNIYPVSSKTSFY